MYTRKFKQIPQTLQGKVISITGIMPGTGKSYTKEYLVNKLRSYGYKVYSLGTSQVASTDQTICQYFRTYHPETDEFNYISKPHPNISNFLFIDEAWLSNQEFIDAIRKDYYRCCIILVGDPSQLPNPSLK